MLWRSRESLARRLEKCKERITLLCEQSRQQQALLQQARDDAEALRQQLRKMQIKVQALEDQPVRLPADPVLPCHHYGPVMIALSINLARNCGLRGAESALQLFHDTYGIIDKVPHWTTIRTWMQRVGVAAIDLPLEAADDWVWMADHSCQIGEHRQTASSGLHASVGGSPECLATFTSQHGDPGIEFWIVQTTGASTFERRLHQFISSLWESSTTGDASDGQA